MPERLLGLLAILSLIAWLWLAVSVMEDDLKIRWRRKS